MANIEIQGENDAFKIIGKTRAAAIHLLRDAIEDIGEKLEEEAKEQAPSGETGALRLHPVDVDEVKIGELTRIPAFVKKGQAPGSSFLVRGPTGFTAASTPSEGNIVARQDITVAKDPAHAIWVHNGTGVYGRYHHPIVPRHANYLVFHIGPEKFVRKSVRGQPAQPFLENAYVIINNTYVPLRVERLRLEIKEIT